MQRKHNIQFYEVVSAFDDPHGFFNPDPQGYENRWMLVARTINGRVLSIICSDEEAPIHRLKLTNTVEDVVHLDLKLINPTTLHVRFKARRSWHFVDDDPAIIEFEGNCQLPE